jgi:hypothetical protein
MTARSQGCAGQRDLPRGGLGSRQEGIFGPMPELEAGTSWKDLPAERRQWYARQGFTEQSWP